MEVSLFLLFTISIVKQISTRMDYCSPRIRVHWDEFAKSEEIWKENCDEGNVATAIINDCDRACAAIGCSILVPPRYRPQKPKIVCATHVFPARSKFYTTLIRNDAYVPYVEHVNIKWIRWTGNKKVQEEPEPIKVCTCGFTRYNPLGTFTACYPTIKLSAESAEECADRCAAECTVFAGTGYNNDTMRWCVKNDKRMELQEIPLQGEISVDDDDLRREAYEKSDWLPPPIHCVCGRKETGASSSAVGRLGGSGSETTL